MKVPISNTELGLVVKSDVSTHGSKSYWIFHRNGSYTFDRGHKRGSLMTYGEFEKKYPYSQGHDFFRSDKK